MSPKHKSEWQQLKRNESLHQSHIDQWWRSMEEHADALEELIKLMPNSGSVIKCALMLVCLQMRVNMLGRTLDEIE
jgi:hypothetical protein